MNAQWQQRAKRIDALSLRERAFLFLSVAVVIAALADSLVLSPALAEQQTLSKRLKQQAGELAGLRQQLASALRPAAADTPEGRLQTQVAKAQGALAGIDAEIKRHLNNKDEMARLPDLMERTLRRHERLTLVKLATLAEPPTQPSTTTGLRWQGVDLSVSGSYLDLVSYLDELERALPGLRWAQLHIGTTPLPPLLTVRVYLVGEAP